MTCNNVHQKAFMAPNNDIDPIKLAIVVGSTRDGRAAERFLPWLIERTQRHGRFSATVLDLRDWALPVFQETTATIRTGYSTPQVRRWNEAVAAAEAYIFVTPEYNHGYPAALKQFIDEVPASWGARPVGFVSYGGVSGGLRAVEQLRQVLAELHAMTVRGSVSFTNAWEQFDDQGRLSEPRRANSALAHTLVQLNWWAQTLRAGRERVPYERIRG